MQTLGLSVVVIGLQMALSVREVIPVVGCLLLGALTGELLEVEDWVERLGEWLKERFHSASATFVEGFVSASVLYISGAMVIVGAIQDGAVGDASTLYLKGDVGRRSLRCLCFHPRPRRRVFCGPRPGRAGYDHPFGLPASLSSGPPRPQRSHRRQVGCLISLIGINILELKKIPVGNLLPSLVYAVLWALV